MFGYNKASELMYRVFGTDTSDTEPEESVGNNSQEGKKAKAQILKKVKPSDSC